MVGILCCASKLVVRRKHAVALPKQIPWIEVEQISKLFLDLERAGIGVGQIALRKVPGGVYSDDAEAFVGRFLAAGYAQARSPIVFKEKGIEICKSIVAKETEQNSRNFTTALSALGLTTQ